MAHYPMIFLSNAALVAVLATPVAVPEHAGVLEKADTCASASSCALPVQVTVQVTVKAHGRVAPVRARG